MPAIPVMGLTGVFGTHWSAVQVGSTGHSAARSFANWFAKPLLEIISSCCTDQSVLVLNPAMAQKLRERYTLQGHTVTVYPDASGQNTSSKNASESDLSILRAAGLRVRVNPSNPAVRDRINAKNALILNDKGERRLKVNTSACPVYTEALEQQAYDTNGDPDKSTGHDHHNDAGGYRLVMDWPIVRRAATVTPLRA